MRFGIMELEMWRLHICKAHPNCHNPVLRNYNIADKIIPSHPRRDFSIATNILPS